MARHRLTALRTYEEASEKEKSTAPIRGRSSECKPIGDRRDTHFTIRRESDDSIVAKCYGSDLIRWYPDGRIFITNDGYASQTTHDFISRLMGGWCCSAHDGKTWMRSGGGHDAYPLAKEGQYFTRHADGYLVAETPNYPVTHQINKTAMRAARKEIAPFVAYFNNMMKLTEWAPLEGNAVYLGRDTTVHEWMCSGDTEKWSQVLTWLALRSTQQGYRHVKDPQNGALKFQYNRWISRSAVEDNITRVLLATHRSKVLTKYTRTSGGWVKDAYKEYADD